MIFNPKNREDSTTIQTMLFKHGYTWQPVLNFSGTELRVLDAPYLITTIDKTILASYHMTIKPTKFHIIEDIKGNK